MLLIDTLSGNDSGHYLDRCGQTRMNCQESLGDRESDLGLWDMREVGGTHPVRWGLHNGKAQLSDVEQK